MGLLDAQKWNHSSKEDIGVHLVPRLLKLMEDSNGEVQNMAMKTYDFHEHINDSPSSQSIVW